LRYLLLRGQYFVSGEMGVKMREKEAKKKINKKFVR
jgi:hypothetical protein